MLGFRLYGAILISIIFCNIPFLLILLYDQNSINVILTLIILCLFYFVFSVLYLHDLNFYYMRNIMNDDDLKQSIITIISYSMFYIELYLLLTLYLYIINNLLFWFYFSLFICITNLFAIICLYVK